MPAPPPGTPVEKGWQQQLLEKGWGCAVIVPTSYQADNGAGLTQGIIGLVNKGQPCKPDDWGTLRAWAWGASHAIDYFETDKAVDTKRLGIEGLSRYGKAALVQWLMNHASASDLLVLQVREVPKFFAVFLVSRWRTLLLPQSISFLPGGQNNLLRSKVLLQKSQPNF